MSDWPIRDLTVVDKDGKILVQFVSLADKRFVPKKADPGVGVCDAVLIRTVGVSVPDGIIHSTDEDPADNRKIGVIFKCKKHPEKRILLTGDVERGSDGEPYLLCDLLPDNFYMLGGRCLGWFYLDEFDGLKEGGNKK